MKLTSTTIRLLRAGIELKNADENRQTIEFNQRVEQSHCKKHLALVREVLKKQRELDQAEKALLAVGVGINTRYEPSTPYISSYKKAGLKKVEPVNLSLDVALAQIAKADASEGKKILMQYGVNI